MAPWSLKGVVQRVMRREKEERVAPATEARHGSRKRGSVANLKTTMGGYTPATNKFDAGEAPADQLRKLIGKKCTKKQLDEKLLEVIIKLDLLGTGVPVQDVVCWDSNVEQLDLEGLRREEREERPTVVPSTMASKDFSERRDSRPPAPDVKVLADPVEALCRSAASRAEGARRWSRESRGSRASDPAPAEVAAVRERLTASGSPAKVDAASALGSTPPLPADDSVASLLDAAALGSVDLDTDIAISQIGFFKFVCLPFFKPVFDLLDPDMPPAVHCRDNFWRWLAQKEAQETDVLNRECPPAVRAVAPPKPVARKRRASVAVLASSLTSMTRRLSGAPRLSAVGELERPRS